MFAVDNNVPQAFVLQCLPLGTTGPNQGICYPWKHVPGTLPIKVLKVHELVHLQSPMSCASPGITDNATIFSITYHALESCEGNSNHTPYYSQQKLCACVYVSIFITE